MKILITTILFLLLSVSSYAQETCKIENPDPNGYLMAICEYIVKNKTNVSPANPNKYKIRKITAINFNKKQAVQVELDCCYLGDYAIIDPNTKDVLKFDVGDK